MSASISQSAQARIEVRIPAEVSCYNQGYHLIVQSSGQETIEDALAVVQGFIDALSEQALELRRQNNKRINKEISCPKGGVCSSGNPDECSCR